MSIFALSNECKVLLQLTIRFVRNIKSSLLSILLQYHPGREIINPPPVLQFRLWLFLLF